MPKKILITGGAGFMGSNFVNYLFNKYPDYQITVLDCLTYAGGIDNFPEKMFCDPRFKFVYGNVCNTQLVEDLVKENDAVIHFAAETHVTRSIADNLVFFETDVMGSQSIASAVTKHRDRVERLIHISTSEVYGTAHDEKMKEDSHPLLPMSPYAAAKAGADRLMYSYWETYKIPVTIIRPFNNYGPNQHLEKLIPRFITSCLLNETLNIHGDGQSSRDWLYVEDLCRGLDAALHVDQKKIDGQVINLGTGRDIDINTIAEIIIYKMQKPRSLINHILDRPGQVLRHTADIKKAKELLNWEPETIFEKGLDKTIEWYTNHTDWWKKRQWLRQVPIKRFSDDQIILH